MKAQGLLRFDILVVRTPFAGESGMLLFQPFELGGQV
jgi:hypothetical protein